MALAGQTKRFIRSAVVTPAAAAEVIEDLEKIDSAPTLTNAVLGVDPGFKIVGGVVALDGSGATTVLTGLSDTIVAAYVTYEKGTSPGLDPTMLTVTFSGTTLSIWPWKFTGTGDCTLIASTNTGNVHWLAYGA